MTTISRPMRGRRATKRLDLTDLREAVRDRRVWTALAVVRVPDGSTTHFEIVQEGGQAVDVLVEVETMPEGLDLTCRLGMAGGPNRGYWDIPPVGAEVAVLIPAGEILFAPTIVGVLSGGQVPSGVAENVLVIAQQSVLIHDGSGGAVALAKKSELDAVITTYNAHTHAYIPGLLPPISTITPLPQETPKPGTTVLKGK